MVPRASSRRINRSAGLLATRHASLRGARGGSQWERAARPRGPMGAQQITQRARVGACYSRAQRVTRREVARDVTGAPPRDVAGARARARQGRLATQHSPACIVPSSMTPVVVTRLHSGFTILTVLGSLPLTAGH